MMLLTTLMETLTEFKALLLNKEQQKSSLYLQIQISKMIKRRKPLHLDHELAAAVVVKKVNLVLICQIFLRQLQVVSLHHLSCPELLLPVGQQLLLVNLSIPRLQQHL